MSPIAIGGIIIQVGLHPRLESAIQYGDSPPKLCVVGWSYILLVLVWWPLQTGVCVWKCVCIFF